jgi:hypothetical protein
MKSNTLTLIAAATLLAVQAHAADPAGSLGAARTVRTVPSTTTPVPALKLPDPAGLTNPANRLPPPGMGTSIDPRTTVDQRQVTLQRPAAPAPSASQGGVGRGGGGAGSGSAWQPAAGGQAGRTPTASLTRDSTVLERQGLNPQPLPPKERAATVRNDLERRGLNPQPLPPKERAATVRNDLERRGLNPQPLPPKERAAAVRNDLERRGLNPQPLPPKERAATVRNDLERRGLNPQPLPPKERAAAARNDLERRGLNPQPLPPREAGVSLQRDSADARGALGGPAQRRLVP